MPVNNRTTYVRSGRQPKKDSVTRSRDLVLALKELLDRAGVSCDFAENVTDESINGAPAVRLSEDRLALAPDLYCEYAGKRFWVEVKDKCQRFYWEDTGINLQELVSFYDIHRLKGEPILLVFKDASLDECMVNSAKKEQKEAYQKRWQRFQGKPYGEWLDNLLRRSSCPYPLGSLDHSRGVPMYIVYFQVDLMRSLETNLEALLQHLDNATDTPDMDLTMYLLEKGKGKKKIRCVNEANIRKNLAEMVDKYKRLRQAGK
ncbi:hypothetical protein [Thermus tengchongensis]|uniref:Endonuclease n=1 Tax=Thermus tengchongensis TaxID=1214928 RepID=A0A4Y9FAR8_9DEIN|nr:hypothetical protein [Thermus tengchongensis]TFU26257.1 hypothetical protein E0687_06560 [Thermus tengchongensis]